MAVFYPYDPSNQKARGSPAVRRLSDEVLQFVYTGDCFPNVEAHLRPPGAEWIPVMAFRDNGPIFGLGLFPKCTTTATGNEP